MKKSDLTRRAYRVAPKHWTMNAQDSFVYGFEAGYRAARADLRRELQGKHSMETIAVCRYWLRPIR